MYWTRGQHIGGGRYEIVDELGRGGFGITYKAKHCDLNSFCVIKAIGDWLRKEPNYGRFVERFRNEGKRLANLAQEKPLMLGEREKQCDIYTLGASLYYAVTKEVPTFSNARKMRNKPLIQPIQLEKSISSQVNQAILWAMELEPGDRPKSMEEWLKSFSEEEEDDLSSDKGVDYRQLQQLLQQQQWREADIETAMRMLEVVGKKENDFLFSEDIDKFPCTDLRTIDRLWVKYSKGQWGFSVQKEIYQSLGGTREYNAEIWSKFGDRVAWRNDGEWMSYIDLACSFSIKGYLPWGVVMWWDGFWMIVVLFSRVETCRL